MRLCCIINQKEKIHRKTLQAVKWDHNGPPGLILGMMMMMKLTWLLLLGLLEGFSVQYKTSNTSGTKVWNWTVMCSHPWWRSVVQLLAAVYIDQKLMVVISDICYSSPCVQKLLLLSTPNIVLFLNYAIGIFSVSTCIYIFWDTCTSVWCVVGNQGWLFSWWGHEVAACSTADLLVGF